MSSRMLFGFLLTATAADFKDRVFHSRGYAELTRVIGAGLFQQQIFGRRAEFALSILLKLALKVFCIQRSAQRQLFAKPEQNEVVSRRQTTIEVDTGDQRFNHG